MIGPTRAGHAPNGDHLDELAVMQLADSEPVPAPAAAHAAACAICAARVATARAEARALSAALALDGNELTFLRQADLPKEVARSATARARRDVAASLAVALVTAFVGYFGWLTAAQALAAGLELARRAGAASVAAQFLTGWAIALVRALWDAVAVASEVPALNAPALPMLGLALMAWLALFIRPLVAPPAERNRAA